MHILTELFLNKEDVFFDTLPDMWRESFTQFMCNQTIYMKEDRFIAYWHDYASWYSKNIEAIEREEKINEIV